MEQRRDLWRKHLIVNDFERKRNLFYTFIKDADTASDSTKATIEADMPRTFPKRQNIKPLMPHIKKLLIEYASFQKGDAYLQGFNYMMTMVYVVFHGSEHAEADSWWCFCGIVGRIRPLMPDYNVTWFHWIRRKWVQELHKQLAVRRPTLNSILQTQSDEWSSIVSCKWFMIWFAQTVCYEELFKLWDYFIQVPSHKLMYAYISITLEILYETAPEITYQWTQRPTNIMHMLLNIKVDGIDHALNRVKGK